MALEYYFSSVATNTKENLRITNMMAKEFTTGVMGTDMRGSSKMMIKMEKEPIIGLMGIGKREFL